jgi:hypothetical protein
LTELFKEKGIEKNGAHSYHRRRSHDTGSA